MFNKMNEKLLMALKLAIVLSVFTFAASAWADEEDESDWDAGIPDPSMKNDITREITDEFDFVRKVYPQDVNLIRPEDVKSYTVRIQARRSDPFNLKPPTVMLLPIRVSHPGTVRIRLEGTDIQEESGISFSLHSYKYAEYSNMLGVGKFIKENGQTETIKCKLPQKGKYYLKIMVGTTFYRSPTNIAIFSVENYPAGKTLKSGKSIKTSSATHESGYFKFYAPSSGYLKLYFLNRASRRSTYHVMMMNYKKRKLFKKNEVIGKSHGFVCNQGLSKGTYYIRIENPDLTYMLKPVFKPIKKSRYRTRRSARNISKGYRYRGIISITDRIGSANWYKFRLYRHRKVRLSFRSVLNGGGSYGGIRVYLYTRKSNKPFAMKTLYSTRPNGVLRPYTKKLRGRLAKGTYYIKICKFGYGNGYYSLMRY